MSKPTRCPRCRTLATPGELQSAIYDRTSQMLDVDGVLVPYHAAQLLGLVGSVVWAKQEITGTQRQRMRIVETDDGPAFMPVGAAEALGFTGRDVYVTRSDRVCGACIEELRRGSRAHRSYRRKGWRA